MTKDEILSELMAIYSQLEDNAVEEATEDLEVLITKLQNENV